MHYRGNAWTSMYWWCDVDINYLNHNYDILARAYCLYLLCLPNTIKQKCFLLSVSDAHALDTHSPIHSYTGSTMPPSPDREPVPLPGDGSPSSLYHLLFPALLSRSRVRPGACALSKWTTPRRGPEASQYELDRGAHENQIKTYIDQLEAKSNFIDQSKHMVYKYHIIPPRP